MTLAWLQHPLLVFVNALAAFRITRLIVEDAIPFGILRLRIRDRANDRYQPLARYLAGNATPADNLKIRALEGQAPLAYLINCYACTGMWVSILVVVLASTGTWWLILAAPLALSALVVLFAAVTE